MNWRPARRESGKRLMSWLKIDEWRHVALTSRLKDAGAVVRFGRIGDGRLWIREYDNRIGGSIYISRFGVVLPAFDREASDSGDTEFLKKLIRHRRDRLFSVIGMENRVLDIEKQIGESASDVESYRIFTGEGPFPTSHDVPQGLSIHRASSSDLDRLWNLEKAYQIEEILRPGNRLNERSGRRFFLNTLKNQEVYYAILGGRPVAKAGTNARGWTYDQIGGVYVIPELRCNDIARVVMDRLLSAIQTSGRRPCLFVKNKNLPALKLYEKLGFRDRGAFRISYWSA